MMSKSIMAFNYDLRFSDVDRDRQLKWSRGRRKLAVTGVVIFKTDSRSAVNTCTSEAIRSELKKLSHAFFFRPSE